MLSMDSGQLDHLAAGMHNVVEEDGEILEDGELDEEEIVETEEVVEAAPEEVTGGADDDSNEEDDEKKKHHRKSHHKRRKRKHDKEDRKSEEKKSRHKKRKGDEASESGGDSPPSKKKKKKKKHSREKKEESSSSPEKENQIQEAKLTQGSESPPLPSEQDYYGYNSYETVGNYEKSYSTEYNQTTDYNSSKLSRSAYGNTTYDNSQGYAKEEDFSSGSDSYYSDFESHLAQYQNYKKNSLETSKTTENNNDDDNYYSVGYDDTTRRQKRLRESANRSHRSSQRQRSSNNNSYSERRRNRSRRRTSLSPNNNHNEQTICRFYQEGKCGKGDKCPYIHQQSSRRQRELRFRKTLELCQFYLTGNCENPDKCRYMHEEYPCKYFHTGTECLAGDKCLFSHEAMNDTTKQIVQKWQDIYNSIDDSEEIEALEKVGMKPLRKPPPGMGLLPTPPADKALVSPSKLPVHPPNHYQPRTTGIPSLFEISVQPTAEMQERINNNCPLPPPPLPWMARFIPPPNISAVPSLIMTDEELIAHQSGLPHPTPLYGHQGGLLPLPTPNVPPPLNPYYQQSSLLGMPPGLAAPPQMAPPIMDPSLSFNSPYFKQPEKMETMDKQQEQMDSHDNESHLDNSQSQQNTFHDTHDNDDYHDNDDHDNEKDEDVIRMNDHDVIKAVKAPDFLPAKQKALFMRIQQTRKSSNDSQSNDEIAQNARGNLTANWTYSSDEDESSGSHRSSLSGSKKLTTSGAPVSSSSSSVQSIMQMISNKNPSDVDTNLLSKVASVIGMNTPMPSATPNPHSTQPMMSPPQHPAPHHRERKLSSTSSSSSPGGGTHPSKPHFHQPQALRRRLSTSELNKEPLVIPLVTKQSVESVHAAHPDPRISLSRLFGKTRAEFRAPLPHFGKELMIATGKLVGLKVTLNNANGARPNIADKDPRLSGGQQLRPKSSPTADPRVKSKPNDPRLSRRTSMSKTTPTRQSSPPHIPRPSVPSKPAALLTKPPSSIIPSLPELNFDVAALKSKVKSPPALSHPPTDPLSSLPKLLMARSKPSSLSPKTPTPAEPAPKASEPPPPTIAPYDPRYISAAASKTTTPATTPPPTPVSAPYDPRAMKAPSLAPPLLAPRGGAPNDAKAPTRTIQLPKLTPAPPRLTPAPMHIIKKVVGETNGSSPSLPTGESV